MANDQPQRADRKLLDLLGKAVSPAPSLLNEERREHILLFNLFGDPLTRLQFPQPIQLEVADKAMAGTILQVGGTSAVSGTGVIQLVCRRDQLRFDPPPRSQIRHVAGHAQRLQLDLRSGQRSELVRATGVDCGWPVPHGAAGPARCARDVPRARVFGRCTGCSGTHCGAQMCRSPRLAPHPSRSA